MYRSILISNLESRVWRLFPAARGFCDGYCLDQSGPAPWAVARFLLEPTRSNFVRPTILLVLSCVAKVPTQIEVFPCSFLSLFSFCSFCFTQQKGDYNLMQLGLKVYVSPSVCHTDPLARPSISIELVKFNAAPAKKLKKPQNLLCFLPLT